MSTANVSDRKKDIWRIRLFQIMTDRDAGCAAIRSEVEQYLKIKECFECGDTASKEFETLFFDHYNRECSRPFTNLEVFRTLLAEKKDLPLAEIARRVWGVSPGTHFPRTQNCDFPSMIKHTINNDMPIMDMSYLRSFFNPPIPTVMAVNIYKPWRGSWTADGHIFTSNIKRYDSLIEWYRSHADRELIPLRVAFECNFPEANISTVKKIDFMIYGGAKLHRYRTL